MPKFIKKKHFTYEGLLERRLEFIPNSKGITPFTVVNGILLMFPVQPTEGTKTKSTWACKCFCGTYFIANYTQICREVTKSCGCISGMRNRWKMGLLSAKHGIERDIHIHKLPTEYRSRDGKFTCNVCDTTTETGHFTEHLVEGRQFCKCSFTYKYPLEDIRVECEDYALNSTWDIVNFPDSYTTKRDLRLDVKCKVCGHENDISYGNFIRDKGCANCANKRTAERLRKDLSYFIEKAVEKHGHKYDYSQVEYHRCRDHVNIICPEHGVFPQSPDNHYNKGKGCPECKKFRLRHVAFHFSQVEAKKEIYLTLPSSVYLMRVGEFIKVGISVVPDKRTKDMARSSKRPTELLYYREMDLYNAFHLERKLHTLLQPFRQDYSVFDGHTECFILEDNTIPELMMSIHCYEELT